MDGASASASAVVVVVGVGEVAADAAAPVVSTLATSTPPAIRLRMGLRMVGLLGSGVGITLWNPW